MCRYTLVENYMCIYVINLIHIYIWRERERAKTKDEEEGREKGRGGGRRREKGGRRRETNQPMVINTATESTVSKLNFSSL